MKVQLNDFPQSLFQKRTQGLTQEQIMTQFDQTREKADQAVHLIFQNKINQNNSFDVDTDFIQDISILLDQKDKESSWLRASASLDASAKIYGYRVDKVYQETYKVLGGLNRQEQMNKQIQNEEAKGNDSLFNMLNGLADQDSNAATQANKRGNKKGMSVSELGYNVIFTGGERTLEKESNIDVSRFDIEAEVDPLFRQRTARFDESGAKNLLINITSIDKGLNVQLDSELDIINRNKLFKPYKRKQDKTHVELEQEKEEEIQLMQWNSDYMLLCKQTFRKEGIDTFTGMRISRQLDMVREEIRKLVDSIRVEKKYKRGSKKGDRNTETNTEVSVLQSEIQTEIDDLDKFIQNILDQDAKGKQPSARPSTINQAPQKVPEQIKKPNHNGGAFITGEFDSYTMSNTKNHTDPFQPYQAQMLNTASAHPGQDQNQNNNQDCDEGFMQVQQNIEENVEMRQEDDDYQDDGDQCYDEEDFGPQQPRNVNDQIDAEVEEENQQAQLEDQEEMMLFKQAINGENPEIEDQRQQCQRLKDERNDQNRMSDLRDAQKMLIMEGRFKVNNQLGTGKQDIFDDLKQQLQSIDPEDSSLSIFKKDKQKRETKRSMIDDEVLRSYDMVQNQVRQSTVDDGEKKDKRQSIVEKAQAPKALLNQAAIDQHLKDKKARDYKPQHLERFKDSDLRTFSTKSEFKHNLKFYETHPLKRLTRLFTKVSWMKLAEIDPANIDYHSIQNIDIAENQSFINQDQSNFHTSQFTSGDKLFEQYLDNCEGDQMINAEDHQSNFSYKKVEFSEMAKSLNCGDSGSVRSSVRGDDARSECSQMSFIQESSMRVMMQVEAEGQGGDLLSEQVPHRKHQNLSLLLQDFSFNQIGGTATEKIQLNKDDQNQPQKRKLKLFQNMLAKQEEGDAKEQEDQQTTNKLIQAKKYDIKQLKEAIWNILADNLPQIDHKTQRKIIRKQIGNGIIEELQQASNNGGGQDVSFYDLIVDLPICLDNKEMAQSLSIHTTFVCLLHLANEHKLLLKQIISGVENNQKGNLLRLNEGYEDFNIFIEAVNS